MALMTPNEQKRAAKAFAEKWAQRGHERGESQAFWLSLLRDVFGVKHPEDFIVFENPVHLGHTSFMDGLITETNVVIEQKKAGKNLRRPERQSDGSSLTPFEQAKRYSDSLEYTRRARWIVTCNFHTFLVYDMEKPGREPEEIKLANLEQEYWRLSFLVDREGVHLHKEVALSLEAGRLIGKIHAALRCRYCDPETPSAQRGLNMLCVRLVFCLFAEHAGLFGRHTSFGDYLARFPADAIRNALKELFEVLDTPYDKRDPYLSDTLKAFPYVNGGLFHERNVEIPTFTEELKTLLVHDASETFDWSQISPTIFGAVFDSTLAPRERHAAAMYYTSVENIRKIIGPLFLERLTQRLDNILDANNRQRIPHLLREYLELLGSLSFLDPASGSGNFLTETYLALRRLENRALAALIHETGQFDGNNPIHVHLCNFYGIENDPFACSVARAALWIAECQMAEETEGLLHTEIDCFPIQSSANIVQANALHIDWNELVPARKNPFVFGNPPFVGARRRTAAQTNDLVDRVFHGVRNAGNLDYVAAWYRRAVEYMKGTDAHAAFVSTNSITQGEQPGILFDLLFSEGMTIDFAWRSFKWNSESLGSTAVTCVIIGFHVGQPRETRTLFDEFGHRHTVKNINAYLVDGPNITLKNRNHPLADVPETGIGNKPIDDGNYLFSKEEKDNFLLAEPHAAKFFRRWIGGDELIYNYSRYFLWLGDATPSEIHSMPEVRKRVERVRAYRLASKSAGTRRIADQPTRMHVTNMPSGQYRVIPEVSLESRQYIPMAFFDEQTLCSNLVKLMPGATLYHFGVLTSSVHMAWTRAVCGRREMRYRYSSKIVFNNFPWPAPTKRQEAQIEQTAQQILDVRQRYPDSPFSALYDPVSMPIDLRKAHQENDKAVLNAYGLPHDISERKILEILLSLYAQLTAGANEEGNG